MIRFAALFLAGFAVAWLWQGAQLSALRQSAAEERSRLLGEWAERILDEAERAERIDREGAARNAALDRKLTETRHALAAATRGRPCLGGPALRVLDQSTGLRPPARQDDSGALPGGSAAAAADPEDEGVATDTDVAGWIAICGDYYERARARIRDIRAYEGGE